jgi:predicted ATP-grasp superfamily ATP-dependent carboligase
MDKSFSVLIPDGESQFALFVAHCLAQFPGVKIHVLSNEKWAPIRFSRYCQTYNYREMGNDTATRLSAVAEIVKKHSIDVLLPTETKWISFVIDNRDALEKLVAIVPLPNPETFILGNDKWLLAQFLAANNIPGPPTVLVTYDAPFETEISNLQFPVLLKPITAWGGEGIERFESLSELKDYLGKQDSSRIKDKFIVQSLLPGFVVGVNVLSRQGTLLATTMQRGTIPNTEKFAAAGGIKFIKEEQFFAIAQKLVSALKWSGFANLDTLYDSQDNTLKILEINARFWGSLRGSLVAGVSFPYLACLTALDIPFSMPDYKLSYYIHPKTAIREGVRKIIGKSKVSDFAFDETGLKFLMNDPLAETMRAFRQEILDE